MGLKLVLLYSGFIEKSTSLVLSPYALCDIEIKFRGRVCRIFLIKVNSLFIQIKPCHYHDVF